jgi:F0F1-type ATP synthase beta subunit
MDFMNSLRRGTLVYDTGGPIKVPVGEKTLGWGCFLMSAGMPLTNSVQGLGAKVGLIGKGGDERCVGCWEFWFWWSG